MTDKTIEVIEADFHNSRHGIDIVALMSAYACDPMGGGQDLAASVKQNLIARLAQVPGAISILAYSDGVAAGVVNCFMSFSTFQAKPILNIHDVAVSRDFRGQGISLLMLQKVEQIALEKGCCKLTLEVLEGNGVAQNAYRKCGFEGYQLDPQNGKALFWQKDL